MTARVYSKRLLLPTSLRAASSLDVDSYRLLLSRVRSTRSSRIPNRVAIYILDRLDS
jgi:hypothetical protein